MTRFQSLLATAALLLAPSLSHAEGIEIHDAYARSNGMTGAVFLMIHNHGDAADHLSGAASDVAEKVELHTHKAGADGVMQMLAVPEGFDIPAQGEHALARGGDHIMMMGLKRKLNDGDTITVTLTFDNAGEITLDVPVDNARKDDAMKMDGMDMGNMNMDGMEMKSSN